MKRKFESGDRVRIKPSSWARYYLYDAVDYAGTVIDYHGCDSILVKFDNFTDGHSGYSYYSGKDIEYDFYNEQHLYMREEDLYF